MVGKVACKYYLHSMVRVAGLIPFPMILFPQAKQMIHEFSKPCNQLFIFDFKQEDQLLITIHILILGIELSNTGIKYESRSLGNTTSKQKMFLVLNHNTNVTKSFVNSCIWIPPRLMANESVVLMIYPQWLRQWLGACVTKYLFEPMANHFVPRWAVLIMKMVFDASTYERCIKILLITNIAHYTYDIYWAD